MDGVRDLSGLEVPIELPLGDPAIDRTAIHPHLAGDGGLREALVQQVSE